MREATSGFGNLSIFWWLNEPLKNAAKKAIALADLDELRKELRSSKIPRCSDVTECHSFPKRKTFIVTRRCKMFCRSLLAGVFPKLCQIGFIYAQPFLTNTFIKYIDSPEKNRFSNAGYALIGAYILVFVGAAVSPIGSWHFYPAPY